MKTITIHPRAKEETILFESLAKALKTPYKINQKASIKAGKKKPSDHFGAPGKKDGERM